jgi:hypothetical protein
MTGYRILSAVQAVAYGALVASIVARVPRPLPGDVTVFQLAGPSWLWIIFFALGALWLMTLSIAKPSFLYTGHMFLIVVVVAYGVANLYTSLTNSIGWLVASLCAALAAGHGIAVRRRPLTGSTRRS